MLPDRLRAVGAKAGRPRCRGERSASGDAERELQGYHSAPKVCQDSGVPSPGVLPHGLAPRRGHHQRPHPRGACSPETRRTSSTRRVEARARPSRRRFGAFATSRRLTDDHPHPARLLRPFSPWRTSRASTPRISPRRIGARDGSWRTNLCGASCSAVGSGSRFHRLSSYPRTRAGGAACTGTTRRRSIESCGARASAATRFRADSQTRSASGRCTCSTAARYS